MFAVVCVAHSQGLPACRGFWPSFLAAIAPLLTVTPSLLPPSSPLHAGSGRTSPAGALTAAANPSLITRRPGSDTGSPLGRYGAVGSPSSQGPASIGAAAEEALSAQMSAITTRDLGEAGNGGGMLPPGWAKVTDGQGLVYYINHVTQEVRGRVGAGGWVDGWGGQAGRSGC
jgi:hypothetical protein